MKPTQLIPLLTTALFLAVAPLGARSQQADPGKPLRLIVPFAAGGPSDNAARVVGAALGKKLGQTVVVENRAGADGALAGQAVSSAAPDGHTLLWGTTSSVVGVTSLHKPAPYDAVRSFAPVSTIGSFIYTLAVHPDVPARSVAELVEHVKRNPDKLSYATGALTEYMATMQFTKATGVSMVRVPYKGGAQVMPDLLAGRVQLHIGPISLHLPYAKEGRLRILATLLAQRSPVAPDVPTLVEAGVYGVAVPTWQAMLAPAKTPREVTDRLARELQEVLSDPAVQTRLEQQTMQVQTQASTEALAATIRHDLRTWQQFIRDSGITQQ